MDLKHKKPLTENLSYKYRRTNSLISTLKPEEIKTRRRPAWKSLRATKIQIEMRNDSEIQTPSSTGPLKSWSRRTRLLFLSLKQALSSLSYWSKYLILNMSHVGLQHQPPLVIESFQWPCVVSLKIKGLPVVWSSPTGTPTRNSWLWWWPQCWQYDDGSNKLAVESNSWIFTTLLQYLPISPTVSIISFVHLFMPILLFLFPYWLLFFPFHSYDYLEWHRWEIF